MARTFALAAALALALLVSTASAAVLSNTATLYYEELDPIFVGTTAASGNLRQTEAAVALTGNAADFSYEARIMLDPAIVTSHSRPYVIDFRGVGGGSSFMALDRVSSSTNGVGYSFEIVTRPSGLAETTFVDRTRVWPLNEWLTVTYARQGGVVNAYLNGVALEAGRSIANTYQSSNDFGGQPVIGDFSGATTSSTYNFVGQISHVRLATGSDVSVDVAGGGAGGGVPDPLPPGDVISETDVYEEAFDPVFEGTSALDSSADFASPLAVEATGGDFTFEARLMLTSDTVAQAASGCSGCRRFYIFDARGSERGGSTANSYFLLDYVTSASNSAGYTFEIVARPNGLPELTFVDPTLVWPLDTWLTVSFGRVDGEVNGYMCGVAIDGAVATSATYRGDAGSTPLIGECFWGYCAATPGYNFVGSLSGIRIAAGATEAVVGYVGGGLCDVFPANTGTDSSSGGTAPGVGENSALVYEEELLPFVGDDRSTNNFVNTKEALNLQTSGDFAFEARILLTEESISHYMSGGGGHARPYIFDHRGAAQGGGSAAFFMDLRTDVGSLNDDCYAFEFSALTPGGQKDVWNASVSVPLGVWQVVSFARVGGEYNAYVCGEPVLETGLPADSLEFDVTSDTPMIGDTFWGYGQTASTYNLYGTVSHVRWAVDAGLDIGSLGGGCDAPPPADAYVEGQAACPTTASVSAGRTTALVTWPASGSGGAGSADPEEPESQTLVVAASSAELDSAPLRTVTLAGDATSAVLSGLDEDDTYAFRVTAAFDGDTPDEVLAESSFATGGGGGGGGGVTAQQAGEALLEDNGGGAGGGSGQLSGSPWLLSGGSGDGAGMTLCAGEAWELTSVGCDAYGGVSVLGAYQRTGWSGSLTLGASDVDDVALLAAIAADAGVDESRVRVTSLQPSGGGSTTDAAYLILPDLSADCDSSLVGTEGFELPPAALAETAIDGADLVVTVDVDSRYLAESLSFLNTAAPAAGGAAWSEGDSLTADCGTGHTFRRDVSDTLRDCGFARTTVGARAGFATYEALLEATTVSNASGDAVFGDAQNRTTRQVFAVRLEFPEEVRVNASIEVFGAVIDYAELSAQAFNSVTRTFTWTLLTSVQWPYQLGSAAADEVVDGQFAGPVQISSATVCPGAAGTACTQAWSVVAVLEAGVCQLSGDEILSSFDVECRPEYTGSCDLPAPGPSDASFTVVTDDFCPQVVEVASITPELTTYSGSAGGTVSTNYILETTLFARLTADVEAGLLAKRTTLTGLDIVSSCTGCANDTVRPFTDGLSAAATAYDFVWEDGGRVSSAAGEVQTDFSFTLNTNSLSFDNDATTGEAQITLTAYATVEYDTPSAQGLQRSYRVQAAAGPGSVGTSASASVGVSSTPAGTTGGSSSTAGSTVLGVSTGTAALAAVGLAAVAAVAVGAAVAARRRRAPPAQKLTASSSSSAASLELVTPEPAPVSTAMPGVTTGDLRGVQVAYDATA